MPRRPRHSLAALAACFMIAAGLALSRSIHEPISYDEQIFVGGAGLMARGGGLIYRDFFYTHLPAHALLLAGLFRTMGYWMLAARVLDAMSAAGIATLLFAVAWRACGRSRWRAIVAVAAAAIYLFDPITAYTVGRAWNHEPSTLAALASFALLLAGWRRPGAARWAFASGALFALAVTMRLTVAPLFAVFAAVFALAPRSAGRRRAIAAWAIGGAIVCLPSLLVIAQAPAAAWFENVQYPGLTARFAEELKNNRRVNLPAKLTYVAKLAGNSPGLLVTAALAPVAAIARRRRWRVWAAAALAGVALATGFVPTPLYQQYLSAAVPFAVFCAAIACVGRRAAGPRLALVAVAIVCIVSGRSLYPGLRDLGRPSTWTPIAWHRDAIELRRQVGGGTVLTLMPALALEAGLDVDQMLAIGRFHARSAAYLSADQRERFRVPDEAWFERKFRDDPPAAVLLESPLTSELEQTIDRCARAAGFEARPFEPSSRPRTLYLRPR